MSKFFTFAAVVAAAFTVATPAAASEGWSECSGIILANPHEPTNAVRICRSGVLAISYDKTMINPALAMYHITPDQAKNLLPGRLSFYEDPDLKSMGVTQAAVNSDAFSDDWNRGHLAPNHIMSFSDVGKKACFTMANIAPQAGYFNQHPWNTLEGKIADWVADHSAVYIVTGVAYKSRSAPTRTSDNIAIPDYYWKVICEPTSGESVGFYGFNNQTTKTNVEFVTVQTIESIYGGKIFPGANCKTTTVDHGYWW